MTLSLIPPFLYRFVFSLIIVSCVILSDITVGAPSTTLATTCSSVAFRKFCIVLSWWLSSCRRCSWVTTTLHREPDMRRYPDPQHLWWQSYCSCCPELWNSLPPHLRDADLPYSRFRQSLRTFLFWWWGHGTVRIILTAPSRNNRTYLLTYLLPLYLVF